MSDTPAEPETAPETAPFVTFEDRVRALEHRIFGVPPVPNVALPPGAVTSFPIVALDGGDNEQPLPAGDTLSVTCADPASLAASIGEGPTLVLRPLVPPPVIGIVVQVSDTAGLRPFGHRFDILAAGVVPEPDAAPAPPNPAPAKLSVLLDKPASEPQVAPV